MSTKPTSAHADGLTLRAYPGDGAVLLAFDLDESRQLFILACQYAERVITRDDYDALATDPDWTLNHLLEP